MSSIFIVKPMRKCNDTHYANESGVLFLICASHPPVFSFFIIIILIPPYLKRESGRTLNKYLSICRRYLASQKNKHSLSLDVWFICLAAVDTGKEKGIWIKGILLLNTYVYIYTPPPPLFFLFGEGGDYTSLMERLGTGRSWTHRKDSGASRSRF